MKMTTLRMAAVVTAAMVVGAGSASAQLNDTETWASHLSNTYRVVPNVTYGVANNRENKVDLYLPRGVDGPTPVLMYIHGGGWVGGSKESSVLRLLPWLEKGWAVVNVQYRLGAVSLAPAAVEDCLCALRWVIRNAEEYDIDPDRIVVTGNSAGGHLALTTGMIPASAGLDRQCPGNEELSVAAIINWYGITDVADLLDGPNMKTYAVTWMGSLPNRLAIADRVSPLTYVRAGLPPVLSIHGDADPTVPYQHGVRLHAELA
ncbi:MAG: alpha/beta hydrolase, partial [bacterium]